MTIPTQPGPGNPADEPVNGAPPPPPPLDPPTPPAQPSAIMHGDLSQVVGRSWAHSVYWLVLAAAAAVDAATFYQVVALVMRNVEQRIIWVVVGGFTILALSLAHSVGSQARQRQDQHFPPTTSGTAWLLFGVWLAMGLSAFVVRYVAPGSGDTSVVVDSGVVGGSLFNSGSTALAAVMFLTLYLATGAVAGLAGYRRPNPAVRRYHRAKRGEEAAMRQLALSRYNLDVAEQALAALDDIRARREESAQTVLAQCDAAAERLKREARIRIAVIRSQPPRQPRRFGPRS